MEKSPKSQKDYYHNKIREFEKRTGKSMNVKGVSMFYDFNIENAEYNFPAAMDMMKVHGCYIFHDDLVEEDPYSHGTHWRKYGFAGYNDKIYIYYFEVKQWGKQIKEDTLEQYKNKTWKAAKADTNFFPKSIENKHMGSNYDDFAKENNIELIRDMNWALKMIESGKMVSREGNPGIILFPKKYDHAESTITTTDLFAEDWVIVTNKTFEDVLDDLYAGKTIRRKSWHLDWGVGKYARYGKIIYLDLIADDWEVLDVVAEVNKQQEEHRKG